MVRALRERPLQTVISMRLPAWPYRAERHAGRGDGGIVAIDLVADPERLGRLDLVVLDA